MVIKNRPRIFFAMVLLLFPMVFLPAQEPPANDEAQPGYFLDTSDKEPRFIQRLSWIGGRNTMRYEIIIEKDDAGRYREHLKESTTEPFVEISLPPGKYRYRVIPYDFLGHAGDSSEWISIEVLAALNPELEDFSPEIIFSEKDSAYMLTFAAKNILLGAQIYLLTPGDEQLNPTTMQVQSDAAGISTITLFFTEDQFVKGDCKLVVINPGGLQTSRGGINFVAAAKQPKQFSPAVGGEGKRVDTYIAGVWLPLAPVYGEGLFFANENISLSGAALRFGMVSAKQSSINLGLEWVTAWCDFGGEQDAASHSLTHGLNLLAQKQFPDNRTFLRLRLGGGYTTLLDSKTNWNVFSTNAGLSFLILATDIFFIEIGFDYIHWLTEISSGALRPWLGIGLQF